MTVFSPTAITYRSLVTQKKNGGSRVFRVSRFNRWALYISNFALLWSSCSSINKGAVHMQELRLPCESPVFAFTSVTALELEHLMQTLRFVVIILPSCQCTSLSFRVYFSSSWFPTLVVDGAWLFAVHWRRMQFILATTGGSCCAVLWWNGLWLKIGLVSKTLRMVKHCKDKKNYNGQRTNLTDTWNRRSSSRNKRKKGDARLLFFSSS